MSWNVLFTACPMLSDDPRRSKGLINVRFFSLTVWQMQKLDIVLCNVNLPTIIKVPAPKSNRSHNSKVCEVLSVFGPKSCLSLQSGYVKCFIYCGIVLAVSLIVESSIVYTCTSWSFCKTSSGPSSKSKQPRKFLQNPEGPLHHIKDQRV